MHKSIPNTNYNKVRARFRVFPGTFSALKSVSLILQLSLTFHKLFINDKYFQHLKPALHVQTNYYNTFFHTISFLFL